MIEQDTSPTPSSTSFGLGVEIGRMRANLDLIMQCLMVLLQRTLPMDSKTSSSPSRAATSTVTSTGTWQKLMSKLSTELLWWAAEKVGKFFLRKVLPSALAWAFTTVSGLGSAIARWLSLLGKMVGW